MPDFISDTKDGVIVYLYERRSDKCGIAFKNDAVVETGCTHNTNHISPWVYPAMILGGVGDGLTNGHSSRITCKSYVNGNYINTNCR